MKERRQVLKIIDFRYNLGIDKKRMFINDEETIFNTLCIILEEHYNATEDDIIKDAVYEYMEENHLIGV